MKVKNCRLPIFLVLCLITLLITSFTLAADKDGINGIRKGQTLYTQFSLFHEKYSSPTTNYRKGILVPVNTEVKFVKAGSSDIFVQLPDGKDLKIENVAKFSGEDINGIFKRTFATKPVDLSKFTANEKDAIMSGVVKTGMSKAAVIIALGYPPKHKTPSLESDRWEYWKNRFNTFVVVFEKDKVANIID